MLDLDTYLAGIRSGDRRILARAITLVESKLPAHQAQAHQLVDRLLEQPGSAQRVGVTGPPGAGKSCLIESLGLRALERGRRIAVLAIDPSSDISGGSILGDKTRMERLSRDPRAFVRPSPSQGTLGGVARRTREAIWVLEAAGFDLVLVETVGVGQSETAVSQLVDTVLLVALPGAGDELQGIKRGVMETADLVFINKAEPERGELARQALAQYLAAMRLLSARTAGWKCPILQGSGLHALGLDPLQEALEEHHRFLTKSGELLRRRGHQGLFWLDRLVEEQLTQRFYQNPAVAERLGELRGAVARGQLSPDSAARTLLELG